jgi:hypothetical protein
LEAIEIRRNIPGYQFGTPAINNRLTGLPLTTITDNSPANNPISQPKPKYVAPTIQQLSEPEVKFAPIVPPPVNDEPKPPVLPPVVSQYSQFNDSSLNKLNDVVNLNDPSFRTRENRAVQTATAQDQWSTLATAQQMAQNPILTTGARNAVMGTLAAEQSANRANLQGDLAQAEQDAAVNAAGTLATASQSRMTYEDNKSWGEYERLVSAGDFTGAAAKYKEITGKDIDMSAMVEERDRLRQENTTKQLSDLRDRSRTGIGELSSDPENRDQAYSLYSGDLRNEIAMQKGIKPEEVSEADIQNLFNSVWSEMTMSDTQRIMREYENDPALAKFFDTPQERTQVATAISDLVMSGGIDAETGQIKEGYVWPWNNPKYAHLYTDWEGNDVGANYDPSSVTTTIMKDGKSVPVTMADVNTMWEKYVSEISSNPDLPIVLTQEDRTRWYQGLKSGKTEGVTPVARAQSANLLDQISDRETNAEFKRLTFGEGTDAIVHDDYVAALPSIVDAIKSGVADQLYPNLVSDSTIGSFWVRAGDPTPNPHWTGTTSGDKRTTLSAAGVDWVNHNQGKVVNWDGGYYVVVGMEDDNGTDNRSSIQTIKLYDVSKETYVYIGNPLVAGGFEIGSTTNKPVIMNKDSEGTSYN